MTNKYPYVVIDTNVLISAELLPNSTSAQALTLAVAKFILAQNEDTWRELESRIARPKFDPYFGDQGRLRYMIELSKTMECIPQVADEKESIDPDDNKFLSLALDAGASIIISGDDDLRSLHPYKGIEILSPSEFLARF